MQSTGICEICGKERVLRSIESGQRLCAACFRSFKPSRPADLVTYATLDAYSRRGIELPDDFTREQEVQLKKDLDSLHYILMNAWYLIVGQPFDHSGLSRDDLELACWKLLQTPITGHQMLALEVQRQGIQSKAFQRAKEDAEMHVSPFKFDNGELLNPQTGQVLTYWDFKPTLDSPTIEALRTFLRKTFPSRIS